MNVEFLNLERLSDFIDYCKKYRFEIDASYLYDEELNRFYPDKENPTYILVDKAGEIKGAASLIINNYNKRGNQARFRILHAEIDDVKYYKMLLNALLTHSGSLEKLILFINLENENYKTIIKALDFNVERYTFVLLRDNNETYDIEYPSGYEIKTFNQGDEEIWCKVRNEGFSKLKGNQTPITSEMVRLMVSQEDYIEGGMKILYHYDKPIGIVRGTKDEEDGEPIMNIGPLAVVPEYQGTGLGRLLLRVILNSAIDNNLKKSILCVNAENERAKKLYIQEGFKLLESVACYKYDLKQ